MTNARILIVEDERLVARDIHSQLVRGQYSVVGVAASGKEAVALATREKPDLVLMDMKLEGDMDGIHAAREIKDALDVPVVYLTAYADDETLSRARLTEPFGYILKPFAEPELRSVIEMALYKHAAERKLRLSEKRFHVTLSSIGDAVIATNDRGMVTFMNPAAEALTQRTLSEATADRFDVTFRLRSELAGGPPIDAVGEALRVGAVVALPSDMLLVRPDGSELPIEATSSPIRDDAGVVTGVVLVFHDATARRVAEERYRQSQKMEAVGQLAGGVAHDFNNILTVIGCYCALARASLPDGHPVKTYVDQVNEAAGQAATLTRQLLAFGRKQLLVPRVLDLNRVLTDAEGMLRRVLGEDIAFTLKLATRLGRVRVDPRQLDQVIVNLALNARDAMPMGGELHIETGTLERGRESSLPPPSSSQGLKATSQVVMVVRDTGSGMTPETKARIFEPFFTTKEKGSGLGLSTVYGIIEQSGGRIEVDSEVGVGTTIRVILPGVEAEADHVVRTETESIGGGHETILVVEDESELRRVITIVLSDRGYRVLSAESAEEAAEILEEWSGPLHLLLTDVVMPKVSGPDLAEHLRAVRPGLRVLFMSGYADDAVVRRGVQAGVMPLLNKPFMPEALARKVREVLDLPPPTGPMRIPVTPVAGFAPRR